jgi:Holliday junction resolvasome RuvABC ATP-dependent DNA helicase subunit
MKPLLAMELATGHCRNVALVGSQGLGKTSLAGVIANTLNCQFHEYVASESWTPEWIVDTLLSYSIEGYDEKGRPGPKADRHVCYIDEAHGMKRNVADALLRPTEEGHVFKDGSPSWLPETTFIISTNEPQKLPVALLSRFALQFYLTPYTDVELSEIVRRNFPDMPEDTANDIARRAKGNPRLSISYGESIQLYNGDAEAFFRLRGIEEQGLDARDRQYLQILRESDRPLSLNSISACLSEAPQVVSQLIENTLIFKQLIKIGPRGRSLVEQSARGRRQE